MNMHKHCMIYTLGKLDHLNKLINIMSVNRSEICYSHILKQHAGYKKLLN